MQENGTHDQPMEGGGPVGDAPAGAPQYKTRVVRPMQCTVLLLNGEEISICVEKKDVGQTLFERVCDHIDLMERSYFAIGFKEPKDPENIRYWLDPDKKITKQKKHGKMEFEFALKFYPPDPTQLVESVTRYLVCLQIRRDVISGKLPCSFATHAMLGSYAVQTDMGDYDPLDHGTGIDYIRDMPFAPEQNDDLLYKIAELHKQHKGQMPEDAELHYLEYAKKIALYGIDLHRARDSDYVDILIGVGGTGISVFRDNLRINRFVWPKILKISYRKNKFLLRIRPSEFETFESWIAFKLPNNKMAKRLWKISVEHHAFLRLRSADDAHKRKGLPRFGSKHRFSGSTLYQTRLYSSTADRSNKSFSRAQSNRSLNSVLNNNRTRSIDNLSYKQPYRNQLSVSHEEPRAHHAMEHTNHQPEPRHSHEGSPRIRVTPPQPQPAANVHVERFEDGRTPLQSPVPNQSPPQFPVRKHPENGDTSFDEDRLPSVPQDSPREARRSEFESFRGAVETPLASLAQKQREEENGHEPQGGRRRSPLGSVDSMDESEPERRGGGGKKPPVAPKPKPPVAKKPVKPSKPKAEKEPMREVEL